MSIRSKLIAAVAIAVFGIASPAFAQSFSRSYGTGNSLPDYYDSDGALHVGVAPQQGNSQVAAQRSGMNAFASVPLTSSGIDSPSLSGGGSTGYNANLRTDY
jgi:hypothetical protein